MRDSHCLSRAEGWLELGNAAEALNELSQISPEGAATVDALRARYSAFAASEQWNYALFVSEVAIDIFPSAPEVWLWRAHAIRVLTSSAVKARDALNPAGDRFPEDPIILLNLAHYEAELGDAESAAGWLSKSHKAAQASSRTDMVRQLVNQDGRLKAMWKSIEKTAV